jgi:hypothetical protein
MPSPSGRNPLSSMDPRVRHILEQRAKAEDVDRRNAAPESFQKMMIRGAITAASCFIVPVVPGFFLRGRTGEYVIIVLPGILVVTGLVLLKGRYHFNDFSDLTETVPKGIPLGMLIGGAAALALIVGLWVPR